jgi:hypothetical protein
VSAAVTADIAARTMTTSAPRSTASVGDAIVTLLSR